ncbi:MAG: hypothetical protein P8075_10575 [Deltaproteobacteria bacterium]|jgi:hypothetical protein
MLSKRRLILLGLPLLWLVLANATCHKRGGHEDLLNSYELLLFQLSECRDMGADSLDPQGLEQAGRLSEEVSGMVEKGNWTQANKAIAQLDQTLGSLLDELKSWDPDQDGLSNYAEYMLYGTSWAEADTDGDGYLDGSEVLHFETDPLDECAVPIGVPEETAVQRKCAGLEKLR